MGLTVFITGATSGIGKACALLFASKGYHIIITGRRNDKLAALQQELTTNYNAQVLSLCFDVQHKDAVATAIAKLPPQWQKIDILINNAGLALGRDAFDKADIEDWEVMINTNVKGLLYVSKAIVPFMIQNGAGHIINIGSTAAKEVYENGNVYCATKAAVEAISKAQRIDLLPYNMKVTCIHPGAVDTEFSLVRYKGDTAKATSVYNDYHPLYAEDVAATIYYAATLPPHVCINDLTITCTQQANSFYLFKKKAIIN